MPHTYFARQPGVVSAASAAPSTVGRAVSFGISGALLAGQGTMGVHAASAAAVRDRKPYGFAPLCSQDYVDNVWSQKASLLAPVGTPMEELFDVADIVELLRAARGTVQVQAHDERLPRQGTVSDFFRNATLTLRAIQARLPRLASWSRAFAKVFGVSCEITLYLTPPGTPGLPLHNDQHDVLAAQVIGRRSWKAWDLEGLRLPPEIGLEPVAAPFRHTVSGPTSGSAALEVMPEPSLTAELGRGALLYVPRGSLHVASTARPPGGASAHLSISALTQSFSYAIAAFHLSAEPKIQEAIVASGWDLHRFRQAMMRTVDHKIDGVDFRRSLPLGWVRQLLGQSNESFCTTNFVSVLGGTQIVGSGMQAMVRSTLEALLRQILLQAPAPKPLQLKVTDSMLRTTADTFANHLDTFQGDLSKAASLPPVKGVDVLVLPHGLHIAYMAWGLRGGNGVVEARFSWCGRGVAGSVKTRWPSAVLPMLEVLAASPVRRLSLLDLGDGGDVLPKLLFAIELEQLPLDDPIKLTPGGSPTSSPSDRDPDCVVGEEL